MRIEALSKSFGPKLAVAAATLELQDHTITCIVGKSGCGKTTLLRLIAGLEEPSTGYVDVKGRIGVVFQEPRLMDWLNVEENIKFADRGLEPNSQAADAKLQQLLRQLGLLEAAKLYPHQLSGGMAQRVALGRTLYYNPEVILMDEPFSALDYFTRTGLQQVLLELQSREHKTIIFVTHDVEEALLLGDRLLIMDKGVVTDDLEVKLKRPRQAAASELQALRQHVLTAL